MTCEIVPGSRPGHRFLPSELDSLGGSLCGYLRLRLEPSELLMTSFSAKALLMRPTQPKLQFSCQVSRMHICFHAVRQIWVHLNRPLTSIVIAAPCAIRLCPCVLGYQRPVEIEYLVPNGSWTFVTQAVVGNLSISPEELQSKPCGVQWSS